jgi:hypothetical protein
MLCMSPRKFHKLLGVVPYVFALQHTCALFFGHNIAKHSENRYQRLIFIND